MNMAQLVALRVLCPALRASRLGRGGAACRFSVSNPAGLLGLESLHPTRSHPRCLASSADSTDIPHIKRNNKLGRDLEALAWNDQISQQTESNSALFTRSAESTEGHRLSPDIEPADPDARENGENKQYFHAETSSEVEIEDFGDYDEEEELAEDVEEFHIPVSLKRGRTGVFDVEEIVTVLESQNGVDIQVIDIPPEARFVDQMVIVSGKSLRHMRGMASTIQWLYNKKRSRRDRDFKLEGKDCDDWLAMDLGNIAVHIFTPEARQHYDLETLWTLGPEHDDERHYVQDDHLNLSAAELFWMEAQANPAAASQVTSQPKDSIQQQEAPVKSDINSTEKSGAHTNQSEFSSVSGSSKT